MYKTGLIFNFIFITLNNFLNINKIPILSVKRKDNDINEEENFNVEETDELTYPTSDLDIGTSLNRSVDYSDTCLLDYVRAGDILYDPIGSFYGVGFTGHIAIVEGVFFDTNYNQYYIRTIEANFVPGVARGLLSPERFNAGMTVFRIRNITNSEINLAIDFCISQLDKPYYLDMNLKGGRGEFDWYCSELVWAAYKSIGIDLDSRIDKDSIFMPAAFVKSPLLGKICKNDTTTEFRNNENTHTFLCDGDTYLEQHDRDETYNGFDKCSVCKYIFLPRC